jgi:hypothetical protein
MQTIFSAKKKRKKNRMANVTPSSSGVTGNLKAGSTFRGIAYSIIVNAAFPYIIYMLLQNYTHLSEILMLAISGIPPIIDTIVGVVRKGRVDLIAGIALAGIIVGIVLVLLGGSPRVYLVRESFFTATTGLVYLISLLFPKPLAFYFARAFVTGNVHEKVEWFNSLWQYPGFRRSMYISTIVWGIGFLLEAVIRTILVFILTIPQFLLVSPFVLYGFIGALIVWNMWYSRRVGSKVRRENQQKELLSASGGQQAS